MAVFRAITAEEEAATAVLLAIKNRHYPNSDGLNFRNHSQKASLFPFILAVQKTLAMLEMITPQVTIDENSSPPKVGIRFDARPILGLPPDAELIFATPIPPLGGVLRKEEDVHTFTDQLANIANEKGFGGILKYVKSEANLRNKLIYATNDGIPRVEVTHEFVKSRISRVVIILTLLMLIEHTSEHQLFVTQCVEAFLRIHDRMPQSMFDFDSVAPNPPLDDEPLSPGQKIKFMVLRRQN